MKKLLLLRGMYGVRALAAFLMVAGFFAAGTTTAAAQDGESGLDGNTFTGPNFGWSVEWDEDVWTFETEDNVDGSDFFQMTTVEDPFAIATFFAGTGYNGDPDDCVAAYEDTLSGLDGNSDVAASDEFELPETPEDGAAAVYTYVAEIDSGDLDLVEYVSCQTVVEDEAVLIFTITTTPNVFEDLIPVIDDLTAAITLPDDTGSSGQDDEDVTPDADEDEDVTPDADDEETPEADEEETPAADDEETPEADEEETPESDEEDAEPTRDVLLGDDEETPAADDDEPQAESGIDGTTYTSPTYGYSVEWDEDSWAAEPADELIDDGEVGLDRLLLLHEDADGFYASFYVEGKADYEGDTTDCLEGEADLLSSEEAVVDFVPFEDENGDPVEGEADSGGEFAAFLTTIETDDGTEVELIEHVECQTLEEGESVIVFTLITSEDLYDDELASALDVIDTLELDGGSASDDSAEDEDTGTPSADDEDATDEEPTEEADAADDEPADDEPADDEEPTEEPTDDEDTARAPMAIGFAG